MGAPDKQTQNRRSTVRGRVGFDHLSQQYVNRMLHSNLTVIASRRKHVRFDGIPRDTIARRRMALDSINQGTMFSTPYIYPRIYVC
jgi:hypothetical protein